MKLKKFNFELPKELVAYFPSKERSLSRLLVVNDPLEDLIFKDLPRLLNPNDTLVINDTKVIKARLFAKKSTGAKVEILIERLLDRNCALVLTKANSRLEPGERITLNDDKTTVEFLEKKENIWRVKFSDPIKELLNNLGHVPLPPYIKREATDEDLERYQTIYADASKDFSVAAPTAGFHFNHSLMEEIVLSGVSIAKVTLHIGLGTFKPLSSENIKNNSLHNEIFNVPKEAVDAINRTRRKGGRVISVGTTALRAIESACNFNNGLLTPCSGETDLFIYPGYKFMITDSLITNFHLPKSSLFILLCAFGGYEKMKSSYQHAIKKKYRFYSYGDAMFVNLESNNL